MDWEFGISRCKVLYTGWINNKVYSTGNYIQCPVIYHDGKEYEKEYTYIHVYIYILYIYKLSHFAAQQKLTLHCKSTILQ